MTPIQLATQFEQDVVRGLSQKQKTLSSKYFYDEIGDRLFQEIMHLDEYYLTRKELEIFQEKRMEIMDAICEGQPFRIIELGAGDGLKTKVLLKTLVDHGVEFTYTPVDISLHVLEILRESLLSEIPTLHFEAFHGDYFDALSKMSNEPEKDIVFFLGSNVGNFEGDTASLFLGQLNDQMKSGDQLFIGVDMKKDPAVILSAYNDSKGLTREFNLNLLRRINQELEGDFEIGNFHHYPYYNPQNGECRSYLISTKDQVVNVAGRKVTFRAWEAIYMEVSKKYDEAGLIELAQKSNFTPQKRFFDSRKWFTDQLWVKK